MNLDGMQVGEFNRNKKIKNSFGMFDVDTDGCIGDYEEHVLVLKIRELSNYDRGCAYVYICNPGRGD